MGLYSSKMATVNESTDAIIKEIEECTSFDSNAHIMEYVLDIHENDHKVFESLIECDFVSAVNESVMTEAELSAFNEEANESKVGMLKTKVHEIVEGIIRKIKELAQAFIAKVMGLFKTDEKIIKKYAEVLKVDNLKDFKGIANFAFPKEKLDKNVIMEAIDFVDDVATITKINTVGSSDQIDGIVEAFKENAKKAVNFSELSKKYFEDPVEAWVPTQDQLNTIVSVLKETNTVKDIKDAAAQIIGGLKNSKSKAKANMKEVKSADDKIKSELEVKKSLAIYNVVSETVKVYSKSWSFYTSLASKQIAACRKAMLICGNYAAKKAGKAAAGENTKGEKVERLKPEDVEVLNNSALIEWAVGESSDMFVAECLGY